MISSKYTTAAVILATTSFTSITAQDPTPPPTPPLTPPPTLSPTPPPTTSPTLSPTVLIGCPPLWTTGSSGSYDPGAIVSHPEDGSGADIRAVYECKGAPYNLYCPQSGYEPGTLYGPNAWTRLGKCNSAVAFEEPTTSPTSSPTTSPTYSLWEKEGCPESFDVTLSTMYESGAAVALGGIVYECGGEYMRCNQAGYEPGSGVEWTTAWTILGSCIGTIVPTASPNGDPWEKLGCPNPYVPNTGYGELDVVESIGSVYECKEYPYVQYCAVEAYAPGVGQYWEAAWTRLGTCEGTIRPTSLPSVAPSTAAPTFALWEKTGCPEEFEEDDTTYKGGDAVLSNGLVFECKEGATAPHCGQAGYEPGTGVEWERAWSILGRCEGTIEPTVAVTIAPWEKGGCPEEYTPSPTTYETESIVSLNGVVYECKPHPDTGFCNIHSPDSDYGYLGWTTLGSCVGTLSPTNLPSLAPSSVPSASPTYPKWEKEGCPESFDESLATMYDEGEVVERSGVVYECKGWPNSAQCNQAGWEPGTSDYWTDAWTVLGSCLGTIMPTSSPSREVLPLWEKTGCPAEFDEANKVNYVEGDFVSAYGSRVFECKPWPDAGFCRLFSPENENGALGWAVVGGCTGTIQPTNAPTTSPTTPPLDFSGCAFPAYSATAGYVAGDLVRDEAGDVYECKPKPFSLWCSNPGYIPGTSVGADAWLRTNQSC